MYDSIKAKEIMIQAPTLIYSYESMDAVMEKFDETGAWNLPVIEEGQYLGFISKSSVFTSYRSKLNETTIA